MPRRTRSAYYNPSEAPDYPLDDYPAAIYGGGYRKLSSTYTGRCLNCANSTGDLTYIDVFFVDDFVDRQALFDIGTSGEVRVGNLDDQTGNGRIMRNFSRSSQPSGLFSFSIPEFNGFEGLRFVSSTASFNAEDALFECDYPCAYLVLAHNPTEPPPKKILRLLYANGGSFEISAQSPNSYTVEYNQSPVFDSVTVVTSFPNAVTGIIMEAYSGPSEIGIVVNNISNQLLGTFASNNGNINTDAIFNGNSNNTDFYLLEMIITDGRQIGLADRLNQYYNFY